jgi:hypothetical protein
MPLPITVISHDKVGAMIYQIEGSPSPIADDVPLPEGYQQDATSPTAWLKKRENSLQLTSGPSYSGHDHWATPRGDNGGSKPIRDGRSGIVHEEVQAHH